MKKFIQFMTHLAVSGIILITHHHAHAKRPAPTKDDYSMPTTQDSIRNPKLPIRALTIGKQTLHVEIARTQAERQLGLMNRKELAPNQGMLFVFEKNEKGTQCFWMKNTLIPLTAAFIDDDGSIVNLADMQPNTEDPHCSLKPVRYVLEMKQGWFTEHKIKAGHKVNDLPK